MTAATFLALNVKLPLRASGAECGVVLDANGRDVFTVDSNGFQPDGEVAALASRIAACVNAQAGISSPDLTREKP